MLTGSQTSQELRQATSLCHAATLALLTAHVAPQAHAFASMHLATALAPLVTGERALLPRPAVGALQCCSYASGTCELSMRLSHISRSDLCTFSKSSRKRSSPRSAELAASKHSDRWQHLWTSCAMSVPPEANQSTGKGNERPIGVLFVCLGKLPSVRTTTTFSPGIPEPSHTHILGLKIHNPNTTDYSRMTPSPLLKEVFRHKNKRNEQHHPHHPSLPGNICRSPTAEALFRSAVTANGLDDRFKIDSAGTDDYHQVPIPSSHPLPIPFCRHTHPSLRQGRLGMGETETTQTSTHL